MSYEFSKPIRRFWTNFSPCGIWLQPWQGEGLKVLTVESSGCFFFRGLLRRDLVFFRTKTEGRSSCFKALESCNGLEIHTGWNKHRTLLKGKCQACSCCCFKCLFFCWGPLASLSGGMHLVKRQGGVFFSREAYANSCKGFTIFISASSFWDCGAGCAQIPIYTLYCTAQPANKQPNHV